MPIATPAQRARAWVNMHVVDHGFVRALYNNFYPLGGNVYRCSQPSPRQIRHYQATLGIRSIINLRGVNPYGSYPLEQDTCEALGITLIDSVLYSRQAPKVDEVLRLKQAFDSIAYPALLHCKSGADRAGIASALFRILRLGHSAQDASAELHWKYGHFKQAKTGILDFFLATYIKRNAASPIAFVDWLTSEYDWDLVQNSFHAEGWASALVDHVLHRE